MTRDEIVLMAKEADLWLTSDERIAAVVRFAELVADAERDALRAAIEQAHGDWDEVEALRASLREHMAEIQRLRSALEQEPVAWAYPEGLEALKSGRPWTAYGSSGEGRIPLYLNDAVARRVEPRLDGSGAGFESLPASPTKWQGLTDDEIVLICGECAASHADDIRYARAIEAKLREKNNG